jgi:hypothetical protein
LTLNWNKDDVAAFSKSAGSLGVSAIAGANPLLGVISLSALAYKYQASKGQTLNLAVDALKGATPTAVFVATAGVVGGPAWVGAVAGTAACIVTARKLGDDDYSEAANYIKEKTQEIISSVPPLKFSSFREASEYAKARQGTFARIKRSSDGNGYVVRLRKA